MNKYRLSVLFFSLLGGMVTHEGYAEPSLRFTASADKVSCYEFVEVTINATGSEAGNPFTEVKVRLRPKVGRLSAWMGSVTLSMEVSFASASCRPLPALTGIR